MLVVFPTNATVCTLLLLWLFVRDELVQKWLLRGSLALIVGEYSLLFQKWALDGECRRPGGLTKAVHWSPRQFYRSSGLWIGALVLLIGCCTAAALDMAVRIIMGVWLFATALAGAWISVTTARLTR